MVELALLLADDNRAVAVDDVVIEIYADQQGRRHLRGRGRVRNILMVELLQDSDNLDLLLDFGDEFKFRLKAPSLQAGKVFSPEVRSVLQFVPQTPWQEIAPQAYDDLMARLKVLTESDID